VQVTILEAVVQAKREFLPIEGVVGVGSVDNTIVFYVETEADRAKLPTMYMGFPVVTRVVGRVRLLG
jgi:hypothetical protein